MPLLKVSLAELRHHGVELQGDEAVAVLLAIGDRLGWRAAPPPLAALILRSDGTVDVQPIDNEEDQPVSAEPYARLLDRLLPPPGSAQGSVPGGIRVLIARATGQTELPPVVGAPQFASQLRRFAPASMPDAIIAVMLRWADASGEAEQPARREDDRRTTGPTASQLRSFLQEGDLERYAMRQRLARVTPVAAARFAELALASAPLPSSYSILAEPPGTTERRHLGRSVAAFGALVAVAAWAGSSPWLRHHVPQDLIERLRSISIETLTRDTDAAPARAAAGASATASELASTSGATGDAGASAGVSAATSPAPGAMVADGASAPDSYLAATHTAATAGAASDVAAVASNALALQPLRTSSSAFSPSFGLDSRSIFFHAESARGSRLLRAATNEHGGVVSQATLLDDGAQNYHVRPSPDGRFLAFDSDRDGQRGVYLADPDGRNIRRVSGSGYAAIPNWSPDGRHLAFVRGDADRPNIWNLWVLDVISGDERQLTRYGSGQVWPGNWFTDGRRIAFTHETTLFVLDTVTGGLRGYESPIPDRLLRTPAVAPDDQHIAFQVSRDGMWILDTFTHRMRRVLPDPSAEEFTWSRDGQRLAFNSRRGGQWGVWLMPAPTDAAP